MYYLLNIDFTITSSETHIVYSILTKKKRKEKTK